MPIFRRNSTLSKHYKDIMNGDFSSINASDVDVPDQYGNTMLHIASKKGNIKLVDHLIKLSANIHIANKKAQTPLDIVNNKILKNQGDHNEYTKIARLLIEYSDEKNNIVHLIEGEYIPKIEFVFLDRNTGKQYTAETIQDKMISSINKIQHLTESNNVRESRIEKAHELCGDALSMIPPQFIKNAEHDATNNRVLDHVTESEALSTHCNTSRYVQEWFSGQQNHPFNVHTDVMSKHNPPVPSKPSNLMSKKLLLQEKDSAKSKSDKNTHSTDTDKWYEIDQIVAECIQYLNNEDASLLGTDSFAQ